MSSRERFLLYATMLVLAVLSVSALLDAGGPVAFASPQSPPATEAVHLAAPDGSGGEIILRNAGGRLSWGESEHQRAYSMGFVHIGDVLRKLVDTDAYLEDREQLAAELREQEESFLDLRRQWEQQYGEVTPDDPLAEEARRTYVELQQAFERFRAEANRRLGQLAAAQLEAAYRELADATNVVADRKGIDIVFRFIPTDDPFEAENPDQAMLAIRLRSVLRYPKGTDITADVLEELALDVD